MKTLEQVRKELRYQGETIIGWARKHGFKPEDVKKVVYGKSKGNFGEAHKIAVTLGIKDGEIVE